ncbi:MAG TPA: DUF6049 family protein [Cellulomonas sp.]
MRLRATGYGRARTAWASALVTLALGTSGVGALPATAATPVVPATAAASTAAASSSTAAATALPAASSTSTLPVAVSVTSVSPQVLLPGDALTVTATLRNDGTETVEAPRASVRIYRYRLSYREQLQSWADSGTSSPIGDVAATVRLDAPLQPGASVSVTVTVDPDAIGLLRTADAWGPRGVTVDVGDGSRRVGIERTFLLWASDDEATSVHVGVLAPVVGPATDAAGETLAAEAEQAAEDDDGSAPTPTATTDPGTGATAGTDDDADDPLTTLTASGGRLSRLLQATADQPFVSWAIDPALVEQASAGSRAAQSWLTALVRSAPDHEVLRLPWADPDLAAIAHAGDADDLGGPDLLQVATATTGATETSAVWEDAQPVLWSADAIPDQTTATLAAASGDGAPLVTGSTALAPDDTSGTTGSVATVGTSAGDLVALVPDATLSALLSEPASVQDGVTPATAAQRVLAETAVLARSDDAATSYVLATMPRDWEPSTAVVQAELAALGEAPWVDTTSVAEMLAAQAAGQTTTTDRAALPDHTRGGTELTPAWVDALANGWNAATAFASVVADPEALLDGLDGDLVSPLSVAWRADPDARTTAVNNAVAEANARQTGLSVVLNEQFTVISSSAQINVTVRNALDQDATVRVELRPRKGCLETARSPMVTVAADEDTPVSLTLHATANCDVTVEVSLVSENGRVLAQTVEFSARVAPTIESVGAIAFGVLLALALAFGIWRTVRRGQTARRGAKVLAGTSGTPGADGVDGGTGVDGEGPTATRTTPTDPDDDPPPHERQDSP